jgi:hypothetical protein
VASARPAGHVHAVDDLIRLVDRPRDEMFGPDGPLFTSHGPALDKDTACPV